MTNKNEFLPVGYLDSIIEAQKAHNRFITDLMLGNVSNKKTKDYLEYLATKIEIRFLKEELDLLMSQTKKD